MLTVKTSERLEEESRMHIDSVRWAILALGGAGVLASVVSALVLTIQATIRKRRRPILESPYSQLPEITVGENSLRIYSRGRELYDAMLATIANAKESIYLESFILKGDNVGQAFKKHLIAKAADGVEVYILSDWFGNLVVPRRFKRFPKSMPTLHTLRYRSIRRPWHLLDPRRYVVDHRKLLVVDGYSAFVGGYNLGALYATDWRDTHVCLRGPAAADVAHAFAAFWNDACPVSGRIIRHYPRTIDPLVSLWTTDALRLTFPIRNLYIRAIDRAERQILLTNAYFIPDRMLLRALKAAARRGVDVQVVIPWVSNHVLADWLARGYFADCLRAGIRIFGYRKAMVHAKTCTIDGVWTTIGTANLDRLSSVGNYEVNLEMYSRTLAQQMAHLFEWDKRNASAISLERWQARPWHVKLGERIILPLRIFT
jgi:cardiolipin synthase A/B